MTELMHIPMPRLSSLLLAATLALPAAMLPAQEEAAKPPAGAAGAAGPVAAEPAPTAAAGAKKPAKKTKVPMLRPSGAFADLPEMGFDPTSLLTGGGGSPPKAFYKLIEAIDGFTKAENRTVVLDLSGSPRLNLPQLREVERALRRVRAQGKRIVCYVESADAATYQVAAQCDRILMADMGMVDLRSPALNTMHMKDALDLLGVQVEVTRVGEFKGAVEPYVLPEMSQHLRHHYEAMLGSMNQDVVRRIAEGRGLPVERVCELQQQRLFLAKEAVAKGLVDQLVPWSGVKRAMVAELGADDFELTDAMPKKKAQNRDFMQVVSGLFSKKKEEPIEDPELVVLHLSGAIQDGDSAQAGAMVSGPSVKLIDELAANDMVKGVVVRINSPGGSATASEAIRTALQRLAAKKPLVFSMGELAASGGYWITTIGEPILAEAGTITGSIGVFSMRFQPGALLRRLGVKMEMVALDDGARMDAIDRPWSDMARGRLQTMVDDIYDRFLGNVAMSRKMTVAAVDRIAGGRVWSGAQAVELGLVDQVGGLDDALAMVKSRIAKDVEVEVRHLPEPKNFADSLFGSLFDAQVRQAGVDRGMLRALFAGLERCDELFALLADALGGQGGVKIYALMPAAVRVR